MKIFDGLRRKRTEKLAEKGYGLVEEGKYDQALDVASELDQLQYSAAFEIAALAYAGKEDLPSAVRVLEEGVEKAPDVWLNWQLLGSYRSDLGLFAEAARAYERALECPGVSKSSIRLNQAVLAHRTGDHAAALRLAGEVDDPDLKLWTESLKVGALAAMGEGEEAERLGLQALSEAGDDADPGRLCSIAEDVGRVQLERGDPKPEIRAFAVRWLEREPGNADLLGLIRDLDGLYSENAQYYRLLVRGTIQPDSPLAKDAAGFFSHFHVVADSPEEALDFVRSLDDLPADLSVEEWEALEDRSSDPKGVYWRSGRIYFNESI